MKEQRAKGDLYCIVNTCHTDGSLDFVERSGHIYSQTYFSVLPLRLHLYTACANGLCTSDVDRFSSGKFHKTHG